MAGYGEHGVAYNHQGQRVGRPHMGSWSETEITLALHQLTAVAPGDVNRVYVAAPVRRRCAICHGRWRSAEAADN